MCCSWDSLWASGSLSGNSRSCLTVRGTCRAIWADSGQPCTRVGRDRGQSNMQDKTRHHERLTSDPSSAPPSTVTSIRSLVSHFLPGCWLRRGSCLKRIGAVWGDNMKMGFEINLLIKSAESWCCAGSFNVPGMHRARRLGHAWGAETGKSPFGIPWNSAPNQAWDRDNKSYLFEVNISLWGLIGGCNFYISWKLCPLWPVTGKDMMMPSLKICQSLLCKGETQMFLLVFSSLFLARDLFSLQLWEVCCHVV